MGRGPAEEGQPPTPLAVATYDDGPFFLLGFSPTPVVRWRDTFCTPMRDGGDPALLVFRRSLVGDLGEHGLHYDRQHVVPGQVAQLACIDAAYLSSFDGLRLPLGFSADGPLLFVV